MRRSKGRIRRAVNKDGNRAGYRKERTREEKVGGCKKARIKGGNIQDKQYLVGLPFLSVSCLVVKIFFSLLLSFSMYYLPYLSWKTILLLVIDEDKIIPYFAM